MNTRYKGNLGEDFAVKYLKKQKYKVIERNFSCNFGEIDVIAKDGEFYVFVEVKARNNDRFGAPRTAVTVRKQQNIIASATYWLTSKKLMGVPVRFDVVEVEGDEVNVIKNAFSADYVKLNKK